MRSWLHQPPVRLGRRGAILLAFSLIWAFVGIGVLLAPPAPPVLIYEYLPDWLRAGLWVGTAIIAAAHCLTPPAKNDGVGFIALMIMPMERAVGYLWAWADHLLPVGRDGMALGWLYAMFYAAFVFVLATCSGWRENSPTLVWGERDRG